MARQSPNSRIMINMYFFTTNNLVENTFFIMLSKSDPPSIHPSVKAFYTKFSKKYPVYTDVVV